MHSIRSWLTLCLLCCSLCTCAAAPAQKDDALKIRVAYYRSYDEEQVQLIKEGYEDLKERSAGKLKFVFFRNSKLGIEPDMTRHILSGEKIDAAMVQLNHLIQYDRRLNVLTAPYLFENYAIAHKAIDRYIIGWMNELLAPHNLLVLGAFDVGFRHVTNYGEEIESAAQISGRPFRVPELPHIERTFKALGAKISILKIESYLRALRNNAFSLCEENTLPAINYYELYCFHNRLSLTQHIFDFQPFVINRQFFMSLTEEQQKVLIESVINGQNKNRKLTEKNDKKVLSELKRHGMRITKPDLKTFISKMKPVYIKIDSIAGRGEMFKLQYQISKLHFGLQ
ncbi:MAG: TRAP transporter substrate-binding protein [Succinivibrio sp.]|nr:TRAP transporter substrate-binding protein [Succinivibrio sp.]